MNAKPTTHDSSVGQNPEMSVPTKYILRCVELRKRKAAETQLIIVRLRAQAGSLTHR
jgi:hypothetical protein